MKLDTIIAERDNKTVYRDGDLCYKVFGSGFSKGCRSGGESGI